MSRAPSVATCHPNLVRARARVRVRVSDRVRVRVSVRVAVRVPSEPDEQVLAHEAGPLVVDEQLQYG